MKEQNPKVQATEISYELHTLGWKAFQNLCATVISELFGQAIQVFLSSNDGGRDGAFRGKWENLKEGGVSGSYTVQCKFSSKPNINIRLADLTDDLTKAERLAGKGLADNYILMTNLGISGTEAEKLAEAFENIPGIKWFTIWGSSWLTLKINESPRLRMLVPRIYGLGDLSQIMDERIYTQTLEILSYIGPELKKFVITDAHRRSAKALEESGFVMLLGEPASGKSMIASTLAIGAIDRWNCTPIKILDAKDFRTHWNPGNARQFFWVDDIFGATQYQREHALEWNRFFPHLQTAIKKGTKILFTSRDYIYKSAIFDLKTSSFPLISNSRVVIDVQKLSISEKEQILYNHIKLGDQKKEFKTRIKPYLNNVAKSVHFLPEVARRLGSAIFTKQLNIDDDSIINFVEKPVDFLKEVVFSLNSDAQAALSLLFMRSGHLDSPIKLNDEESISLSRIGSSLGATSKELKAMNGSLVFFIGGKNNFWQFKHPTISEAIGEFIANDPELIDIYIYGTPGERLIKEITCGKVGFSGVKVIIPQNKYHLIIDKLSLLKDYSRVYSFLAYRCSKKFLKMYLKDNHWILDKISNPISFISASNRVSLLVKIHEYHLLPEEYRKRFVSAVAKLAVETPDAEFLIDKNIRSILTSTEIEEILNKVRSELLPDLGDMIYNWRLNYDRSEDPISYFDPLKEALKAFVDEFSDDEESLEIIEQAFDSIQDEIRELLDEIDENDYHGNINTIEKDSYKFPGQQVRSIFDDVDL